jgi:hypothetical protein
MGSFFDPALTQIKDAAATLEDVTDLRDSPVKGEKASAPSGKGLKPGALLKLRVSVARLTYVLSAAFGSGDHRTSVR